MSDLNKVKFLYLNKKLSVTQWELQEDWAVLSLLNTFRKWAYEKVFSRKVIGIRINGSAVFLENHDALRESVLEILSKLKNLTLKSGTEKYSKSVIEGPSKVKAKKLIPEVDPVFADEILMNVLPGEKVEIELLFSDDPDDLLGELIFEGKNFISVSKDLSGVSRCYFEELLYKKGSYRLTLETGMEQDHKYLIERFLFNAEKFFSSFQIEQENKVSKLEETGISERSLAILKVKGINSFEELIREKESIAWGDLSIDSVKILKGLIEQGIDEENEVK